MIELTHVDATDRETSLTLSDVSLSVPAGTVFGLLGASDAGTTTLLTLIAGLMSPNTGNVVIEATDTIFVPAYHDRRLHTVVEALLAAAPLVLLEEPAAGLDQNGRDLLAAAIRYAAHEAGKIVIVATSEPATAQRLCDRIAVLDDGRLVATLDPAGLREHTATNRVRVRVGGRLSDARADWFDGLTIMHDGAETILSGDIPDQPALHGLIAKIRNLGLSLQALEFIERDIEDITDDLKICSSEL